MLVFDAQQPADSFAVAEKVLWLPRSNLGAPGLHDSIIFDDVEKVIPTVQFNREKKTNYWQNGKFDEILKSIDLEFRSGTWAIQNKNFFKFL